MLIEYSGIVEVMKHPQCQSYDANGQNWHIFDFDPTVTTLRQRALPAGKDFPEEKRLSEKMKPGYSGRKRGDVQFRRATLQHHGSGGWIQMQNAPGNGQPRKEAKAATQGILHCCTLLEHPPQRALIRCDGEFAGVPYLSIFIDANIAFVTRCRQISLWKEDELLQKLKIAEWKMVADAGTGPQRMAADLGWTWLKASANTLHEDGTPFEPVLVRIVVSRIRNNGEAQRGFVEDGWQYELFSTSLQAQEWPAEAVITSYFERTAQENRFFQEDRELKLDRIFSYHLVGQEFVSQIGLMVWNMRIAEGFSLHPLRPERPVQKPYQPQIVSFSQTETQTEAQTETQTETQTEASISQEVLDASQVEVFQNPNASGVADIAVNKEDKSENKNEPPTNSALQRESEVVQKASLKGRISQKYFALKSGLNHLDWSHWLKKNPGWQWSSSQGSLVCLASKNLYLTSVSLEQTSGKYRLFFRGSSSMCRGCTKRSKCFRNPRSKTARQISFYDSTESALKLKSLLYELRTLRKKSPLLRCQLQTLQRVANKKENKESSSDSCLFLPVNSTPCLYEPHSPLFLPAVARRAFSSIFLNASVYISLDIPPPKSPQPILLAKSVADRQQKRMTWIQHQQRYDLEKKTQIYITFEGAKPLADLLGNLTKANIFINTG